MIYVTFEYLSTNFAHFLRAPVEKCYIQLFTLSSQIFGRLSEMKESEMFLEDHRVKNPGNFSGFFFQVRGSSTHKDYITY